MIFGDDTMPERFWAKIRVRPGGCWAWTASTNGEGYGTFNIGPPAPRGDRMRLTHRLTWETLFGPVPDGLELDHACRVRECCNPAHLEAVTHQVNVLRGTSPAAAHAVKTHCPSGHPYDGANTHITKKGVRQCRACDRERKRVAARRTS